MADGYSRWKEDFAAKEKEVIDTNLFVRPCPQCRCSLEIKLSPEKDDITISYTVDPMRDRVLHEGNVIVYPKPGEISTPDRTISSNEVKSDIYKTICRENEEKIIDRKCAYCFRNAIRGGVLCREHAFCFGDKHGPVDVTFSDGKPYELKDRPLCKNCSEAK